MIILFVVAVVILFVVADVVVVDVVVVFTNLMIVWLSLDIGCLYFGIGFFVVSVLSIICPRYCLMMASF